MGEALLDTGEWVLQGVTGLSAGDHLGSVPRGELWTWSIVVQRRGEAQSREMRIVMGESQRLAILRHDGGLGTAGVSR